MLRVLFNQRHIADETTARDAAFQQVVAEDGAVWQPAIEHGMAGRDIQQPLAGKAGGSEQVLVDVGHRAVVGVHAGLSGEQAMKARVHAVRR